MRIDNMRADLRPLTYWVIHEKYKVRFKKRSPELVQGIVTTLAGEELDFDYYPEKLTVHLPDRVISIDYGGWVQSESPVDAQETGVADVD